MLETTLVWAGGEFGRTPMVDWAPPWNGGRNHYATCFSTLVAGGGFKDTTRIASSNADMWADICMTNSEAIVNHIRILQGILGEVAEAIENRDREALYEYFAESKKRRDSILEQTRNMYELI